MDLSSADPATNSGFAGWCLIIVGVLVLCSVVIYYVNKKGS